ncbi:MAG: NADH:ubiquinone reductase (Na(+)-transporting) subunit C [Aliivibrio sp.]|uniref:NADH:ubiquinone reductase (Na(+)-transporting) subunit C n=1 Tax=Aliivibrio sp. TaxID=1872443 RepID=UPI001A3BECBB|nr:NADH:ubiquinone reductase (Na(+)-transporting) subunit C [Aliivibrio sp.]
MPLLIFIISGALLLSGCGESDTVSNNDLKEHGVKVVRLDKRLVLVETAGLVEKRISVVKMMEQYVEPQLVDLRTGQLIDDADFAVTYDQEQAEKDPDQSIELTRIEDLAGIKRRENIGKLYLIKGDNGDLDKILVPIRAYGRFSMIYGFLALEAEDLTIFNIGFYQHGETPSLGAEFVNDPGVAKRFVGKKIFRNGHADFSVIINHSTFYDEYSVDGVSGASYTSRAVERAINYWCGTSAFGPAIHRIAGKRD